jgi:hypothetical protein
MILKGGAMAAATTFVPVEEYLRSSFEPDAEYVDGQIEERAVGENDHSAWQGSDLLLVSTAGKETGQIRVRPSFACRLLPHASWSPM